MVFPNQQQVRTRDAPQNNNRAIAQAVCKWGAADTARLSPSVAARCVSSQTALLHNPLAPAQPVKPRTHQTQGHALLPIPLRIKRIARRVDRQRRDEPIVVSFTCHAGEPTGHRLIRKQPNSPQASTNAPNKNPSRTAKLRVNSGGSYHNRCTRPRPYAGRMSEQHRAPIQAGPWLHQGVPGRTPQTSYANLPSYVKPVTSEDAACKNACCRKRWLARHARIKTSTG